MGRLPRSIRKEESDGESTGLGSTAPCDAVLYREKRFLFAVVPGQGNNELDKVFQQHKVRKDLGPRKHLAVIPARGGSKGIYHKNIHPLKDRPLIDYTLMAALKSKIFNKIVVTTDSTIIEDYVEKAWMDVNGLSKDEIMVIRRDPALGCDDVPLDPVVIDAYKILLYQHKVDFDAIWTLQPTSPLRTEEHIKKAHEIFESGPSNCLISVKEERHSVWESVFNGYLNPLYKPDVNRQYVKPIYVGNGAITITDRNFLWNLRKRVGGCVAYLVMDEKSSMDIHTIEDIKMAEFLMGGEDESSCYG